MATEVTSFKTTSTIKQITSELSVDDYPALSIATVISLAQQGDANAQLHLGWRYAFGHGVTKDIDKALVYYQLAAKQDNALAQTILGIRYLNGDGVIQDINQAHKWFTQAAVLGNDVAKLNLAFIYQGLYDSDSPSNFYNPQHALSLFQQLAKQGDDIAQLHLAYIYYQGSYADILPQDWQQAWYWFGQAAIQGNKMAQYMQAKMYLDGDIETAIAHASHFDIQQALDYYQAAAIDAIPEAQYALGHLLQQGNIIKKDTQSAIFWLTKAANQGHTAAQYELVAILYFGQGITPQPKKAVKLMQQYASHN
ncbi:tetratricopeptide repeat protein [Psychrobacter sp. I-STPA10]|uniref:tetratricopeptide repeat protein n=1 Tax=Psychrobacter sp. I-STPA10 TaxID=2585769 RepID=UPI001E45E5B2|nr:SEL1-like repeat protein [Psychrobacter sp. I-STPA10]